MGTERQVNDTNVVSSFLSASTPSYRVDWTTSTELHDLDSRGLMRFSGIEYSIYLHVVWGLDEDSSALEAILHDHFASFSTYLQCVYRCTSFTPKQSRSHSGIHLELLEPCLGDLVLSGCSVEVPPPELSEPDLTSFWNSSWALLGRTKLRPSVDLPLSTSPMDG